jgi:hypothetical protein
LWDYLASLKLTILCLTLLMVLVFACTLAQVDLGTFGAVKIYMRSMVVRARLPGTDWLVPIYPGGALVGLVLLVNLVVAQARRLEWTGKKAGLWISHAGLIMLFGGEFISGALQVDSQMSIEEGQTTNHIDGKDPELAVVDGSDPAFDEVFGVRDSVLSHEGTVTLPGTSLQVRTLKFFRNAELKRREPNDPPSPATAGMGSGVTVMELAPVSQDDAINESAAYVEILAGGKSMGTFLVAMGLGAPQQFMADGKTYSLSLRPRRQYLPYSITLKDFKHDVYPGTDIPKNFSSLIHLSHPAAGEERDVLVFMNQPLRYDGKAFYQASFGKGDTLSVLQVVDNPGWTLPYISCALITLGLLIHFGIALNKSMKRVQRTAEA